VFGKIRIERIKKKIMTVRTEVRLFMLNSFIAL
jgi:hypothetical protein